VKDEFERIVATVDVPMFVVTASDGDEQDGCLVGFATQCSINPPRFLVCLSNKNRTTRIARRAAGLVVHVLRADQRDLAELFGGETGDEVDKLARVKWRGGPHGAPVLEGCDWFAGAVLARHELGDHDGFLVHVDAAEDAAARDEQLGYKAVRDLDPGHDA
jgi:flavin reductase (DIM6/NTAB) family NADH-FMN oxidoreductase RutF